MLNKKIINYFLVALVPLVSLPAYANFTDVTTEAGFLDENARGGGWADFNSDGCIDVYLSKATTGKLFQSNCDGTFTDVTVAKNVSQPASSFMPSWADYDNDGDLDLYITSMSGADVMYRNDNGSFTDVTVVAGLGHDTGTTGASWADYDNDGDLDMFLASRFATGTNSDLLDKLYMNNGDGTFTDVAASAGIAGITTQLSFGGTWFDYDMNGTIDLYIAVDFGSDILYSNNGNGTFTDVSAAAGIADPQHGMGTSVADFNSDGCLDVLISNNNIGDDAEHRESVLYQNNCDGTFSDISVEAGIQDSGNVEWGLNFVDYDFDTDLDISIVAGGMLSDGQSNVLYENSGLCHGTKLTDVTAKEGVANAKAAFGSAWIDYDQDGDLDWFVANAADGLTLYRNDGPVGNSLKVVLQGDGANNSYGVGAVVSVKSGGVTQTRVIQAGVSYVTSEEIAAFFGLGVKDMADEVNVTWSDGTVTQLTNVAANQTLTIDDGNITPPADGVISGTTVDVNGVAINRVRIRIRDVDTGLDVADFASDSNGEYSITLPAGEYLIAPFKPGFTSPFIPVTLAGGDDLTINIVMQ